MLTLFCGYDEREREGLEVFVSSVRRRSTVQVDFRMCEDIEQVGTNAFTMARFLVADRMQFKGHAIFCDASDQVMLDDIAELSSLFDPKYAVQVVKHREYKTKHPVKYIGTDMECPNLDYPRKNWASVMLINCEAWRDMTEKAVRGMKVRDLLQFKFLPDSDIGELPDEWNRLVDEGHPVDGSKIAHWTAGTPNLSSHYQNTPGADLWRNEQCLMQSGT
jgi:hypothetical protein